MRTILVSLLFSSVALAETNLPSPAIRLTPEYINQLAAELQTNNQALFAARARTNAAAHGIAAVRTWEDPMIRGGYMFADDQAMMQESDGDLLYGVEQKLPLWGKPQAMRRMARAELNIATADADMKFQVLRSDLARALFRAALACETVLIGEQDLSWVSNLQAAAEARYRSGAGSLPEVLRLQNEASLRGDQLTTARAQLRQEEFSLNRILNRPADTRWPRLNLPPLAVPVIYNERLVRYARDYEPRLRKMREEIRMAEATTDKARRERYPEVSVGVDSRNDSSNGDWRQTEVMVSLSVPIFNRGRYRADIAREEAKRKAAEFDVADMELAVREEVHGLTVKIDAARREALLYREEIIPRSEQALAAAQSAWQSGNGMFLDVLEARRMLLEARLMSARAITEQWTMLSELVLCCGLADMEALQMLNVQPESQSGGNHP